jgi:hypothetical protein
MINSCNYVTAARSARLEDLLAWNPNLDGLKPCQLQQGIVESRQVYYLAVPGDGCWGIADNHDIALDDFYTWNTALNGNFAGL